MTSAAETEVMVIGGGAAGLHVALEAAEAGARDDPRLAQAARRELELLGAGRAGGGARPRRLARAPRRRHARRRARAVPAKRRRGAGGGGPGGGRAASRARRALRRRARRRAGARARGRALGTPHRPRRGQRDRARDHLHASPSWRRPTSGSTSGRPPRRRRCGATASAASARSPTEGRSPPRRRC